MTVTTQIDPDKTTHALNLREFEVVVEHLMRAGNEEAEIARRLLDERMDQKGALLDELKSGAARIMQCTVCGAKHKVAA